MIDFETSCKKKRIEPDDQNKNYNEIAAAPSLSNISEKSINNSSQFNNWQLNHDELTKSKLEANKQQLAEFNKNWKSLMQRKK